MSRPRYLLVTALVVAACATPPKPRELEAFEKISASNLREAANKRAPETVKEAQALLDNAQYEWKNNDLYEARRDALLGQIKLKTVYALVEQDQSRQRVSAANAEYTKLYDEWTRTNKEYTSINEQLALLQKLGAARSQAEAANEQLKSEQNKSGAQDKLRAAELAIKSAEAVESRTYAKVEITQASDALERANLEFKKGDYAAAGLSAELAKTKAEQALQLAKPEFDARNASTSQKARNEQLQRDASAIPGVTVRIERRGDLQRLVLPLRDLFVKKATTITPGKEALLDAVAALVKKYPSYAVQIIGHTDRKGRPTELVALSLTRAQSLQGALLSRGVEANRLTVTGQGADEPVADNKTPQGRASNNRVEVVFTYQ